MRKDLIFGICITAFVAIAAWATSANARSSYFGNYCSGCHGSTSNNKPYSSSTCAGCHAHGTHSDSYKNDININATPDSTTYNPGDTIVVQVGGGYRAGWVRVQMWGLDCSIANTCNQSNVLAEESLYTSGSEVDFPGPVALTATVPDTPGDYTWYAGWYGNEYDTSTGNNASNLWIADSTNPGHGNELVAFTFKVTSCTVDLDCDDGEFCNGAEICDAGNCVSGTAPSCDDGVDCTVDSCDVGVDACVNQPDNGACADTNNCTDDTCTSNGCTSVPVECSIPGEQCDPADGTCKECLADADCDDGQFCNGQETCDANGSCQAGNPVLCDDGIGCTEDICNEVSKGCDNVPNNTVCNDGNLCTDDICTSNGCTYDPVVCSPGEQCDPTDGICKTPPECTANADCDDGQYCNGQETCDGTGSCQAGTPVVCDDGVGCTDDTCNEGSDSCVSSANDANCPNDGQFCTGTEFCDAVNDCSATGDPCQAGETCNEGTDTCDALTCAGIADKGTCDADPNCQWIGKGKNGFCQDIPPAEDCADGIDNDGDGLADCDDPDCAGIGICPPLPCAGLARAACQSDPSCEWSGKNKVCSDTAAANCSDYNGDAKACRANGCSYSKKTDTCD